MAKGFSSALHLNTARIAYSPFRLSFTLVFADVALLLAQYALILRLTAFRAAILIRRRFPFARVVARLCCPSSPNVLRAAWTAAI